MTTDQLDNLTRYLRDGCPSSVASDLGAALEALGKMPKCGDCGKPATCFGVYDNNPGWSCGTCCDHGNEDGFCVLLADLPQHYSELEDEKNDWVNRFYSMTEERDAAAQRAERAEAAVTAHADEINRITACIESGESPFPISTGKQLCGYDLSAAYAATKGDTP